MLINMNKNVNENHEYKMKQQWKTLSLMCVVLMAFLTIFLMRAYRRNTENIFKAYKTIRDKAVFTDKRMILFDVSVLGTEKKIHIIPYKSISTAAIHFKPTKSSIFISLTTIFFNRVLPASSGVK